MGVRLGNGPWRSRNSFCNKLWTNRTFATLHQFKQRLAYLQRLTECSNLCRGFSDNRYVQQDIDTWSVFHVVFQTHKRQCKFQPALLFSKCRRVGFKWMQSELHHFQGCKSYWQMGLQQPVLWSRRLSLQRGWAIAWIEGLQWGFSNQLEF